MGEVLQRGGKWGRIEVLVLSIRSVKRMGEVHVADLYAS